MAPDKQNRSSNPAEVLKPNLSLKQYPRKVNQYSHAKTLEGLLPAKMKGLIGACEEISNIIGKMIKINRKLLVIPTTEEPHLNWKRQ